MISSLVYHVFNRFAVDLLFFSKIAAILEKVNLQQMIEMQTYVSNHYI